MTRREFLEHMVEGMESGRICAICGAPIEGFGNNPYPVVKDEGARCCDLCDSMVVIPARIRALRGVPDDIEAEVRKATVESISKFRERK